ncbi:MAG TPA: MarR family transcriptional regulator [Pseudonocardia sp.]|jgi:MarR family transcriptional regulator, organic hydroperoxide resistance regulator|nr:MarR family transcriptional regulator [Pseudonocardia sp.]
MATERSEFLLNQQLCFALHDASRAMTGAYRPLLEEIGLTYSQYAVMLVLWEHGSVSLGFLCEQLHLDSGTLSPLLKRLEAQGALTRKRRVEDERTIQLTLTSLGWELRARARGAQARVEVATALNLRELTALRDELHALAARLRAAELQPGAAS